MPQINIHAHCDDHEAVQAIYEALSLNTSWFSFESRSDDPEQPEEDLTPPHGIDRTDIERSVGYHVSALMAWTREHISTGPVSDVSDEAMWDAFYSFVEGADVPQRHGLSAVQMACLRGAFKDAQGGMVPL